MVAYTYIIYTSISYFAVSVPLIAIIVIFLQRIIFMKIKTVNKKRLEYADLRAKKVKEIISGINTIKFNGLEDVVAEQINGYRKAERKEIFKIFFYTGVGASIGEFIPLVFGLICFWLYTKYLGDLTLGKVFQLILVFRSLIGPIMGSLTAITNNSIGLSSDKRIRTLYNLKEKPKQKNDYTIEVGQLIAKDATFNWGGQK